MSGPAATVVCTGQELTEIHQQVSERACSLRHIRVPFGGGSAASDLSFVPSGIQECIESHITRAGFGFCPVSTPICGSESMLAQTQCWLGSPKRVVVRDHLSPASLARVSVHEWSHVASYTADMGLCGVYDELLAESVAVMVTSVLGITDGEFSPDFLASWIDGDHRVLEDVRPEAIKRAARLLASIFAAILVTIDR